MKTIGEVSRQTSLSIRALRHYDAIGLLPPTRVTDAGYRLYDEAALERLRSILFFRELRFPLGEIKAILDRPGFDPKEILTDQLHLLELQRARLDELIALARETIEKGGEHMDFSAFDDAELERYAAEAKARWGQTPAHREFAQRTAGRAPAERRADDQALMSVFGELETVKAQPPESETAQAWVARLQDCITSRFYTCTPDILWGLGEMYVQDGRMRATIDGVGGPGAAAFAHQAIVAYCAGE